jgi:hypothetical protein
MVHKAVTRVSFLVRQGVCVCVRTHEGIPRRNTTGHTTTSLFNGDTRTTRICRKPIFRSSHAFYTRKSTQLSNIVYYFIKYCVLKVVLVVFVMFCIDDNPLFGFLDQ